MNPNETNSSGSQDISLLEPLDEQEAIDRIASGTVGRLAFSGRYGLTVLPVNYAWHENSVVLRTAHGSPLDEDLRTGIPDAEYQVAFEIDDIDMATRQGWSVLVQGSAHHVDSDEERQRMLKAGVEVWPGGKRELFMRIIPSRITGRAIRRG